MFPSKSEKSFPKPGHDHDSCIADALRNADEICKSKGLRFTALRRRVLEIIWAKHEPTGAYDILEELSTNKTRAAPPTVYRTLDFLLKHGFVHKIESLNAFVGCGKSGDTHAGQFLICEKCNQVGELDDPEIAALIEKKAASIGFKVGQPTVEILGVCGDCRTPADG